MWRVDFVRDALIVCGQCFDDYDPREELCVRVAVEGHPLFRQNICAKCVADLGITGCHFVSGRGYVYDRLGADEPPSDWTFPRPTWREQLEALGGILPRDPSKTRPELAPLDFARELDGLRTGRL
jgi:hypothetical protein